MHVEETPRETFLKSLSAMPEEAFGWIVATLARTQIFPDGLGGFREDSRRAIRDFQKALKDYGA